MEPVGLDPVKPCPLCGERILTVAKKCRYCQEYLDPEHPEAVAARIHELHGDPDAFERMLTPVGHELHGDPDVFERMLTPVGRPASAIAAGYLGLFSLMPFFGPIALIVSLFALRTLKRHPELSGRGRAIFGLIMGTLFTLLYGGVLVAGLIQSYRISHDLRP